MILRHKEHKVPGLNTTSTADISFMLLIFFLVTTNMDVDKGLPRQLPAVSKSDSQESYVAKGTTMALKITADDRLFVDDKPLDVKRLRSRVEAFVSRVGKRHLITVAVDPTSSYDAYFNVQNELMAAYRQLRDDTAQRLFGRNYNALSQSQKDKVKDICPQRIAEQQFSNNDMASGVTDEEGGAQ